MKTKFTPGPWEISESAAFSGDFVCHIHQAEGAPYTPDYSDVAITITGERKEIQLANAHLMAAAPEMYEMLESLREEFGGTHVVGNDIDKLLAKARGE